MLLLIEFRQFHPWQDSTYPLRQLAFFDPESCKAVAGAVRLDASRSAPRHWRPEPFRQLAPLGRISDAHGR